MPDADGRPTRTRPPAVVGALLLVAALLLAGVLLERDGATAGGRTRLTSGPGPSASATDVVQPPGDPPIDVCNLIPPIVPPPPFCRGPSGS